MPEIKIPKRFYVSNGHTRKPEFQQKLSIQQRKDLYKGSIMAIFTATAAAVTAAATAASTISATAATVGTLISAAGTVGSLYATNEMAAASKEAEALRKKQMELDNRRRINQLVRESQANRARAISAATVRGALESSALEGGLGSISSQASQNINAQMENYNIGSQLFDVNARYSEAKGMASNFSAAQDFGKTLFNNSEKIGTIGETLFKGTTV